MKGVFTLDDEGRMRGGGIKVRVRRRVWRTGGGGAFPAKIVLADGDAPRLVANVDKYIPATVESAKRDAGVNGVAHGVHIERFLNDKDGLFESFAGEAEGGIAGDDTDGAVFTDNDSGEGESADAFTEGRLGDIEKGVDGLVGPRSHF